MVLPKCYLVRQGSRSSPIRMMLAEVGPCQSTAMASAERDDRVLPLTRGVAWFIVPFLVVAFSVLWPVPTDTDALFAWHIVPTVTPMILGSAYLGGAYFFVRAGRATQWQAIKGGFVPVAIFATL